MKVLVVEDDPNLRALWGAVIEKAGYAARLVETEAEAKAALSGETFDLLLLDLLLGENNGIGVAAFAKQVNPTCSIVVVTGSSVYSKRELFSLAPSVWAVMRKPVDIEDIIALCSHVANGGGQVVIPDLGSGGAEFRPT
ncbi:MAG: response regulator [Pseudomonadota bacterium]